MSDYPDVVKELKELGERLGFRWVPRYQVQATLKAIRGKFAGGSTQLFFWDSFRDFAYADGPESWRLPAAYSWDRPVMLILYDGDAASIGFEVPGISQIPQIISEDYWFNEFIVLDDDLSWCFMYNHHDVLFACGDAKAWLQEHGGQASEPPPART